MLAWNKTEPGHELARVFGPRDITNLGNNSRCDGRIHATQGAQSVNHRCEMPVRDSRFNCLIQCCNPFLGLVNGALEFFEDQLLVPVGLVAFGLPVRRGPWLARN